MASSPEALIARFALQPHPEGGWYRELQRAGLTVIVFLLTEGQRLPPQGGTAERLILGPFTAADAAGEATDAPEPGPLQVVPALWWQAARSRGRWSLVHCCVGPGFSFEDFRLMADLPPAEWPAGADPALL